jgi:hypothetical protein
MNDRNSADLVPLEIAVRCVFSAIYDDVPTPERLSGLAQAMVVLVPVYTQAPHGEVSTVTDADLRDGLVRDAGTIVQFPDGRPALTNLFIAATSVDHAIRMLAAPGVQADVAVPSPNGLML